MPQTQEYSSKTLARVPMVRTEPVKSSARSPETAGQEREEDALTQSMISLADERELRQGSVTTNVIIPNTSQEPRSSRQDSLDRGKPTLVHTDGRNSPPLRVELLPVQVAQQTTMPGSYSRIDSENATSNKGPSGLTPIMKPTLAHLITSPPKPTSWE